jgi:GT2 family glycosyltransferase
MQINTQTLKPKVSVVSIALKSEEFQPLIDGLKRQTFQDYEFVGEAGGTIPEAWNRAIRRANGDIVVLTETDARPVNERWLEEMVTSLKDEKTFVKGLEVNFINWDLSNLAIHRRALLDNQFDESFHCVTDIEFLCRLKSKGFHLIKLHKSPVLHLKKSYSRRFLRYAFQYGLYWARLHYLYTDPINLSNVAQAGKTLAASFLNLLGLVIGYIIYLPERHHRKNS